MNALAVRRRKSTNKKKSQGMMPDRLRGISLVGFFCARYEIDFIKLHKIGIVKLLKESIYKINQRVYYNLISEIDNI